MKAYIPGRGSKPKLHSKAPMEFERGLSFYRRGFYWEAHEVWERLWKKETECKNFLQALIQISAACLKRKMQEEEACRRLLHLANKNLDLSPPMGFGLTTGFIQEEIENFIRIKRRRQVQLKK